jgi:ectoine hydroxylase-related dioxygenase (phytanoyl-CoA dioxygenase family)
VALVADYAAGDVVVHTAHTVHAALDNVDPSRFRPTGFRTTLANDIHFG